LGLLFGAMYFLQGIGEPTEGLIAQPVRSLLKSWGHDAAEIAGTVFALLMSLTNLSNALSSTVGGYLYESWLAAWGSQTAFNALVGLGALFTAACWLLVPLLGRQQTLCDGEPALPHSSPEAEYSPQVPAVPELAGGTESGG
jgi:MFS family permease